MIEVKQSTATVALVFYMVDDSDHVTPKTGLSPTVTISKNGGAFATPAGAVTEMSGGFYKVEANASDGDTLGMLALKATSAGADPVAMAYAVVANLESDTFSRLAATPPTAGAIASAVRTETATELGRIDVPVSSRNATAPDNLGISAIKAKTDTLPALPAATGDIPTTANIRTELSTELGRLDVAVSSRNATAPDNAGVLSAISGLNDLTAAQVRTELAVELARIDAAISSVGGGGGGAGLSPGVIAALEAAEQILLASLYAPVVGPTVVVTAPADADLTTVYINTEDIIGEAVTDAIIQIILTSAQPALSAAGRVVSNAVRAMVHDDNQPGLYTIELESGLSYRAENSALFGGAGKSFILGTTTLNLIEA